MAKNSKKMQMVDDDEVENVGIMSGFMDDIDEIMEEIMREEEGTMSGEDDEMARVTGRTPKSPEILMNNLRGNMRSIDARREELAERVGYNAAAETPDEVLAMLQPILAQEEMAGIASMMAPQQGLTPNVSPRDALSAPPAMPEGVASLPMDQGPMPMPPAGPAPAPMPMRHGGIVQHFQDGTDEEGVTAVSDTLGGVYPPEVIAQILPLLQAEIAREPMDVPSNVMDRTKELEPMYAELLGVDKNAAKAQFLASLGQAALRYAGNVGPSGERLSGSPIARLAAGFSDVPAAAAKAAATVDAQQRQARLAALQAAQAERTTALDYNAELRKNKLDIYSDILKQKPQVTYRPATAEEKAGLSEADQALPWQMSSAGRMELPGGRPPVPAVDMTDNKKEMFGLEIAKEAVEPMYNSARDARSDIRNLDETIELLQKGNLETGFGAELKLNINRVRSLFSDNPELLENITDVELLNSALGKDVFGAISDLGVGARGLDTPAEREFLREVVAGRITLTKDTLLRMAAIRRKAAVRNIEDWNELLESGRAQSLFEITPFYPTTPMEIPEMPQPVSSLDEGPGSDRRRRVKQILGRNE